MGLLEDPVFCVSCYVNLTSPVLLLPPITRLQPMPASILPLEVWSLGLVLVKAENIRLCTCMTHVACCASFGLVGEIFK